MDHPPFSLPSIPVLRLLYLYPNSHGWITRSTALRNEGQLEGEDGRGGNFLSPMPVSILGSAQP
jgi:hypothetical protein